MKTLYSALTLVAALCLSLPALPQEAAKPGTEKAAVEAVLNEYLTAVRTYDAGALDRLFDPEYVEVSPVGEVDDREKTLGFYRVPADKRGPAPESLTLDEVRVRFPSDSFAVAIGRETFTVKVGGNPITRSLRATFTLRRSAGAWRLYGAQFTGMRPAAR